MFNRKCDYVYWNINWCIMITEDYVSFETAKLLKEKGFKGECLGVYFPNGRFDTFDTAFDYNLNDGNLSHAINAPTLQMAIKWLRKTHKIFFNTNYYNLDIGNEWLQLRINRLNKIGCEVSFEGFDPEEQYEKAIKYCLENLI